MILADVSVNDPVVAILAVILSGGLIGTIWQIYRDRKRGPGEMQDVVTKVTNQVMEGAQDLLNEYKIQIEVSQRQIEQYLSQLSDLNRLLGAANARIAHLESELKNSLSDRDELHQELSDARRDRDLLEKEITELRDRVEQLIKQQQSIGGSDGEQK